MHFSFFHRFVPPKSSIKDGNKLGLSSAKLSGTKFGWYEVIFEVVLKQFAVKKILWSKKFGQNFYKSEKFWFQTNWFPKNVGSKKIWLEKFWSKEILCPKYFGSKKILGQKEFWSRKIKTHTKLGQNWVRNNWAIHDMKKSCQHKYCLYKCHGDIWNQRWSQDPTFKVWLKSCQYQLRYSWYGQMSPGQILPGQMFFKSKCSLKALYPT